MSMEERDKIKSTKGQNQAKRREKGEREMQQRDAEEEKREWYE